MFTAKVGSRIWKAAIKPCSWTTTWGEVLQYSRLVGRCVFVNLIGRANSGFPLRWQSILPTYQGGGEWYEGKDRLEMFVILVLGLVVFKQRNAMASSDQTAIDEHDLVVS